jgi:hypothetical protein
MQISEKDKSNLIKAAAMLLIIVSLFFLVKIVSEVKGLRFIGGGAPASNTVSFEGRGEVMGVPDLATVSFTIKEEGKDTETAQDKAATKEKQALDFLEESGVAKKDIKTEGYNSYPKYDYGIPCYGDFGRPCRQESPQVIGYETTEYVSVKVRDLEKVGEIIKGIGGVGISEISGPNFTIENEDELKAEARKMAIDEAKEKAEVLSRDLGVRLVRIVSFSEGGNYYTPMYATKNMAFDSVAESAPAPELPTGENKIISNVTITYEIR